MPGLTPTVSPSLLGLFRGWLHAVAQAGLGPLVVLLLLSANCWNYRYGHHAWLLPSLFLPLGWRGCCIIKALHPETAPRLWQLFYQHLTESFQTLEENPVTSGFSFPGLLWRNLRSLHSIPRCDPSESIIPSFTVQNSGAFHWSREEKLKMPKAMQ